MKFIYLLLILITYYNNIIYATPERDLLNHIRANFHQDYKSTDSLIDILYNESILLDNEKLKAEALLLKGATQTRLNKYEEANRLLFQALRIFNKLNLIEFIIETKLALGFNNHFIQNHEYSIKINKEALDMAKRISDTVWLYKCNYSLGRAYGWSQEMAENANKDTIFLALKYFNKASEYITNWKDSLNYIPLIRGYGDAYLKLRKYQKAEYYFSKIYNLFEDKNSSSIFISAVNLGEIYTQTCKFDKAIYYLRLAEKLAIQTQDLFQLEWAYLNLYMYYEKIGNTEMTLKYHIKVMDKRIKRMKADQEAAISKIALTYETEQKDQQLNFQSQLLSLQSSNLKNQKKLLLAISAGLFMSMALGLFYYRLFRKNKRISEQNALLVREQSHRVKNNLQVISALLNLQANRLNEPKAKQAIEDSQHRLQVMSMIHQRLYGDNTIEINVKELIKDISHTMIHALWPPGQYPQLDYNIMNIFLPLEKAVPLGLIVNELITNSLKHAFADQNNPQINISLQEYNTNKIHFAYTDNGSGFNEANTKRSFGLLLIDLQSRQLFGQYQWKNDPGTSFSLNFKV